MFDGSVTEDVKALQSGGRSIRLKLEKLRSPSAVSDLEMLTIGIGNR